MVQFASPPCLVVYVTCPNREEAQQIASALVSRQLAACVNIVGPIESIYAWEEKLEQATEFLLIIKTRPEVLERLESVVKSLHSYTVPEVLALPVLGGALDYLSWVAQNVH